MEEKSKIQNLFLPGGHVVDNAPWRINPLRGNEKVPLKTLRSWLPKEQNHPEYEKIKYMIEFKEKQINGV